MELDDFYEWKQIDPLGDVFSPRTGHTAAHIDGKIYVFGGSDNENVLNDLHAFDVNTSRWSDIKGSGNQPSPRSGCKVCKKNSTLYFTFYLELID